MSAPLTQAQRIALLNDACRQTLGAGLSPGKCVMTCGVAALSADTQLAIFRAVQSFTDFTADNDPYGEHDFGALSIDGHRLFWKIDTYADHRCELGGEHPDDPQRSYRVLTIMLADEY